MSTAAVPPLAVYGAMQSFFTRKVTGYLDYSRIPWHLRRGIQPSPEARAGGWPGGIPAVFDADGAVFWDSTSVIEHLDHHHHAHDGVDRTVFPSDPTQRFLAFVLDDFNDEWFYRPGVGTRWLYPENTAAGSWDLARDAAHELPIAPAVAQQMVTGAMTDYVLGVGVSTDNIGSFVDESLKPWFAAFSAHLEEHPYLFGARPSIADFAFYGADAAHFVNDPLCWAWVDESGPEVVQHTIRLTNPIDQTFGDWLPSGELPETLLAVLAEAGRHYLPWMTAAVAEGSSIIEFDSGATAEIAATEFLKTARGVMLARYVEARTPEIDAVLDAAGILAYYADYVELATKVPDPAIMPRPADNRPYPT